MAMYRGVSAAEIQNSMINALELNGDQLESGLQFRTHLTWREVFSHAARQRTAQKEKDYNTVERFIAATYSRDAILNLTRAPDDAALEKAIEATGMKKVFGQLDQLLEFHRTHNTNREGRKIIEAIDAWGGREEKAAPSVEVQAVIDRYIAQHKSPAEKFISGMRRVMTGKPAF